MFSSPACSRSLTGAFSRLSLCSSSSRTTIHVCRRTLATVSDVPTSTTPSAPTTTTTLTTTSTGDAPAFKKLKVVPGKEGALRPHLGIEVNPNHGLYAFFRKVETEDGEVKYETLEAMVPSGAEPGRSWSAAELRRKSFKDLHTLWYVLLRERNLLATQREEARRLGIDHSKLRSAKRSYMVRKSMARIKYVLNERRLAYEGAAEMHNTIREMQLLSRKEKREERERAIAEKKAKEAGVEGEKKESELSQEKVAARLAAGGLF